MSHDIREKLLQDGDTLNMENAIEIAITHETTQQHLASNATGEPADNVNVITGHTAKSSRNRQHSTHPKSGMITDCRNCGGKHKRKECPVFGKECLFLPQKEPLGQSLHGKEEWHERQIGPLPGGRRR